jgi:hypothetical protein
VRFLRAGPPEAPAPPNVLQEATAPGLLIEGKMSVRTIHRIDLGAADDGGSCPAVRLRRRTPSQLAWISNTITANELRVGQEIHPWYAMIKNAP